MSPRNTMLTILAVVFLQAAPLVARTAGENPPRQDLSRVETGRFEVDEDEFQSRKLAWSYFVAMAKHQDVMIIDVRSGFLPAGDPQGLDKVRPIPLEIFLKNFVARKVHQDKTLLILDESGHQLRRLQFHLTQNGYDDFYFLEGGAESYQNHRQGGS